jgi:ankyrin repeat protein
LKGFAAATPLCHAAKHDHLEIVKHLLEHNADATIRFKALQDILLQIKEQDPAFAKKNDTLANGKFPLY